MVTNKGVIIFPVAVHLAALGLTTAALGPADGLAGALGLDVALGDGLGPPTAGWSGLVTKKAAPTAIKPMTVAAASPPRSGLVSMASAGSDGHQTQYARARGDRSAVSLTRADALAAGATHRSTARTPDPDRSSRPVA
jgi:hypothetical protein